VGRHLTRWLIPLPAILFALIPQNAKAEPTPGLETTYYTIDVIPPVKTDTEYPVCGTETENNINRSYDGELFEDCTGDMFMVHMTGFIEIPEHNTIEFMLASDDGGTIKIGLDEWGNWNDQGCTWMMSGPLELDAGSQPLDLWMYENGGGACLMLAWNIDDAGWVIVPDEAFTQQAVATTTTVSSTTTSTTTTEVSTTTTSSTTTLPISTTTTTEPVQISTTTSTVDTTTTTTTTTSTTVPQTTTTTEAPYTPPQTTTTTPTIEPQPEPATPETETTVDEPETTEPETSTTYPDETLPELVEPDETTIPETTVPYPEVEPAPDETEQPTDTTEPQEYTTETTLLEETDSSPTTLPELETEEQVEQALEEVIEDEPVTDEQVEQILETLTEAEPEQIVAAITQVLAADITSDQATEIASSPEVLAAITETQAEQLFEEIVVEELTEEQLEQFTEAIQQAPTKVKKAFEKTIDIFGSQFEDYVPTGSNIPVGERRTLVAAGALIAAIPSTRIRR
jgi:hypothetical protein